MKLKEWFAALALLLAMLAGVPAAAIEFQIGALTIDDPWARGAASQRAASTVYFTITNNGEPDRLIGAVSSFAEEIEFRETVEVEDVIRSIRLSRVNIPQGTHVFNPRSAHLIFLRSQPLQVGTKITVALTFELAGTVEIQVPVMDSRAIGPNPD